MNLSCLSRVAAVAALLVLAGCATSRRGGSRCAEFALPDEAVDKLRTAARRIMHASPDFQRFLKDTGGSIVPGDRQGSAPAGAAQAH